MAGVVIQAAATGYSVIVPRQDSSTATTTKEPPNPILPVGSEMVWGLGSFLLLVVLMRVALFPKLKKGMNARHAKVQADLEGAERVRAEGADDVARYQAALAVANAEAASTLEAARNDVDADRQTKITAANARIGERRAAAAAEIDAARRDALARTEPIVAAVAASAAERVLGQPVDREAVRPVVAEVMSAGVTG